MRTRLLASTAVLLAATLAGCGDETHLTSDPGHVPSTTPSTPSTPSDAAEAPDSTPPATPSEAQPADIGRAFRAFARGGDLPPLDDRVDLYLGNAFTGVLTAKQARNRRDWATCTETGSYAGATCPLSPLTVLRQHHAVEVDAPRGHCLATYGPLPPDLRKLDRTVLAPRHGCAFAIQLLADDGQLAAVSTLLATP